MSVPLHCRIYVVCTICEVTCVIAQQCVLLLSLTPLSHHTGVPSYMLYFIYGVHHIDPRVFVTFVLELLIDLKIGSKHPGRRVCRTLSGCLGVLALCA